MWIRTLFAAFLGVVCGVSSAQAATLDSAADFELMQRRSHAIVIADVVSSDTVLTGTRKSDVETHTKLRVVEYLKGQGARELMLRQWGGISSGGVLRISSDARMRVGKRVLVFLRSSQTGALAQFVHLTLLGYSAYDLVQSGGVTIARPHERQRVGKQGRLAGLGEEVGLAWLRVAILAGAKL